MRVGTLIYRMLLMENKISILNRCVHTKRTNKLNEIWGSVVLSIHSEIVRRIDEKCRVYSTETFYG